MKNFRIHCIQHEEFEGPGCILDWINAHGYSISYTHIYKGEELPSLQDFDMLLVMGGSMSTYDEETITWLKTEKSYIKEATENGKFIVGVCLGSQLIANSLGAEVYPNTHKEIGISPIYLSSAARKIPMFKGFSEKFQVFHWHGDTFDLPQGAIHLAYSHACHNQMFLYNNKVLGIQCHLEVTEKIMEDLITQCGAELISSPYIQSADEMRNHLNDLPRMNQQLFDILDSLLTA